jgi:LCP family protein required for cell wall assembly
MTPDPTEPPDPSDDQPHRKHGADPSRPGTVYHSQPRFPWGRRRSEPSLEGIRGPAPRPAPQGEPGQARQQMRPGSPGRPQQPLPPVSGRPAGGHPRSRRRPRARWLVITVVLLLIGYPIALFAVAWTSLGRVEAIPDGDRPVETPGRTFLVVGSDSREDLNDEKRAELGTGQVPGQRTDTIMLLHVPTSGPTVLISVPRDSYVPIPGYGMNKINAAYAFGGPQLLIRTLENVTDLRIDSYVETGLGGYADLVDAVGGVTVCVKSAMRDKKAHLDIEAGCQTMDGATALGYARARYSDPRGDLGRVERQRQVLAAIASKTLSPSVVAVPWRAFPAAAAGGHALTVDSDTTPWGLTQFILAMRDVAGGSGLSLTVPISDPDLSTPAGSAVKWDTEQATALFEALRTDDTEAIRPMAEEQAEELS